MTPAQAPVPPRLAGRALGALAALVPLALLALARPEVYRHLPGAGIDLVNVMRDTSAGGDRGRAVIRGYYEDLNQLSWGLREIYAQVPPEENWISLHRSKAVQRVDDVRAYTFAPNKSEIFRAARLETNRWGMRDRDYEHEPAPGVARAAMLGPCNPMGWGVPVEKGLVRRLEDLLNEGPHPGVARLEVMNFAVGGYTPPSIVEHLTKADVLAFHPRVVFYHALPRELMFAYWDVLGWIDPASRPKDLPPWIRDIIAQLPASDRTRAERRRLWEVGEKMLQRGYAEFAQKVRAAGALPVWLYVVDPNIPGERELRYRDRLFKAAEAAGFVTVDVPQAFDDVKDRRAFMLADWELHPTVAGHERIARAIYARVLANDAVRTALFQSPSTP